LAASFSFSRKWGGVEVDEGGAAYPVTGYGVGYWLWLVSMMCAFIASLKSSKCGGSGFLDSRIS